MKTLGLSILLMGSSAFAADLNVNVKNFSFNYDDPKGSGSASSFSLSGVQSLDGVQVAVEKVEDVFKIAVTGTENQVMDFKNAPAFMTDATHMDINNFNLDLSSAATLSMTEGNFNSPDSDLMMKGFSLGCTRDITQTAVMDQLLAGCMKKMTVRSSDFSSVSKKTEEEKSALVVIAESLQSVVEKSSAGSATRVKSLKVNMENGKYDLSANVKTGISGDVTSKGNMTYDAVKGELTIKISEVKFSILNVTGQVFDALKKKQSPKFKVSKPYITITVK